MSGLKYIGIIMFTGIFFLAFTNMFFTDNTANNLNVVYNESNETNIGLIDSIKDNTNYDNAGFIGELLTIGISIFIALIIIYLLRGTT